MYWYDERDDRSDKTHHGRIVKGMRMSRQTDVVGFRIADFPHILLISFYIYFLLV